MGSDSLILFASQPSSTILEELVSAAGFTFRHGNSMATAGLRIGTDDSNQDNLDLVFKRTKISWPSRTDQRGWSELLDRSLSDHSMVLQGYEACTRLHAVKDTVNHQYYYEPWLGNPYAAEPLMNLLVRRFRDQVLARAEKRGLNLKQIPRWPDNKQYALVLSHDIDLLSQYSLDNLRTFADLACSLKKSEKGFIELHRRAVNLCKCGIQLGGLLARHLWRTPDPQWNLETWLALERTYGVRSTFFISPYPDKWDRDPPYNEKTTFKLAGKRISFDDWVRWVAQEGWEIAVHGGLLTPCSESRLEQEAQLVKRLANNNSLGGRQHYLSYSPVHTGKVHLEAKLHYDSSLGYNEILGFRNSAALPFYPRELDLVGRGVLQIPLVIQDAAIFAQRYDFNKAVAASVDLIEVVKDTQGCAALSFHTGIMDLKEKRLSYEVYRQLLSHYGKDEKVWLATAGEVAAWWEQRASLCRG